MKTQNLISIIVPAFKEAGNIPVLTGRIDQAMANARLPYEIIIVDDNSQDGIVEAVNELKKSYPVTLIVREDEKGLSSAVIAGFAPAKGTVYAVMDADLSHPPEKLPDLVTPILDGKAEFVIGSRFVKGGSALHFGLYRKANALLSRLLARPFTRVKDPMAGFFAFPSHILKKETQLNPLGFKIGLELLVKCSPKSVIEIPIEFQERLYGESKLTMKQQILYIVHLQRLFHFKYRTLSEFIRFGMIGASGMIIDLSAVYLAKEIASFPFRIARIIGFVFALTSNFLLNRRFTFGAGRNGNIYRQYAGFFAVSVAGFAVNWVLSVYLYEHHVFFNRHYLIASFLGIMGGMTINFTGSKFLVFHGNTKDIR